MKNNPQLNLDFEKNTPKNDIDGVLQAYLAATHAAVAGASRALWPVVEAERRRQVAPSPQPAPVVPVETTPVVAAPAEPLAADDVDAIARQTRATIDAIYAEVLDERQREDYDRAA